MRHTYFVGAAAAALLTAASMASAQTAARVIDVATQNTATGYTGTAADVAFRGLGVTREATPRFVYQDRNFNLTTNPNSLWQWTGTGAPTLLATQTAILAASNVNYGTAPDIAATLVAGVVDMEGDSAGNVYVLASLTTAGLFREEIFRISAAGAVTVLARGGLRGAENAEGANSLAYDNTNDRLYVNIDNFSSQAGSSASGDGAGIRGIHVINNARTASNVTLNASTQIISEATINAAVIAQNASVTGSTSTDANIFDIAFRPLQADLILTNANTSGDNDCLFRVQNLSVGAGAISLFASPVTVNPTLTNPRFFTATPALTAPALLERDNEFLTVNEATGDVYVFSNAAGAAATATDVRRNIWAITADGSSTKNVITENGAVTDLGGTVGTGVIGDGTATNPTDRALRFVPGTTPALYFINRNNASAEGLVRVTGFTSSGSPASVSNGWTVYE